MDAYNIKQIKQKVHIAVGVLFKYDSFLLENDVNERAISHKLAEYLQLQFTDFDVDCEYNRMNGRNADVKYITKKLGLQVSKSVTSDDAEATTVFPDIIIHKRHSNKDNLLVVEIKKQSSKLGREHDFKKLRAFTSELEYALGLYLEFSEDGLSSCKCFKLGEEYNCEKLGEN